MLEKLLSNSNQRQVLGVALTPGVGLEVALYDRNKNVVLKYDRRKVEYNFSTREIFDYVEFKSALGDMIADMDILPKTQAYLVLPNVYFDFAEMPPNIPESGIQTALLSKAEEFYLFKKEEPVSGWCNVLNVDEPSQKKLAYTSFQKSAVDTLKDIFNDVGLVLIGLESAYSATVRGLYSVGLLTNVIAKKESWTVIFINTNSFTLMYFGGDNLLSCSEVPIAIKSFSTEEAYAAIASSAIQLLDNYMATKLFIVSHTDDISAVKLQDLISFDGEVKVIDTNSHSHEPVVEVQQCPDMQLAPSITFTVIGAANARSEFGLVTNVLADEANSGSGIYFTKTIFGQTVDVTSEIVMKLSIALALVIFAVLGGLALLLFSVGSSFEKQAQSMDREITSLTEQIAAETKVEVKEETVVDVNQLIDQISEMNVVAVKNYDSISTDIPKDVWLTKYYNKGGDRIVIQGISEDISQIYEYFKNIKVASPESSVKLNELKVVTNEEGSQLLKGLYIDPEKDRLYSFEISNTTIETAPQGQQDSTSNEDILIRPTKAVVENLSRQVVPVEAGRKNGKINKR